MLMETGKARTSAFNRIIKWIKTIIAKLLLHFVYYDNQLIKMATAMVKHTMYGSKQSTKKLDVIQFGSR